MVNDNKYIDHEYQDIDLTLHKVNAPLQPDPTGMPGKSGPGPGGFPSAQALADLSAYPVLTEEVGYPPSPVSSPSLPPSIPGQAPLGQIAFKTIADVLGWKGRPGDNKGFIGALTQSFALSEVEGHVQATWQRRSIPIQSDLSGGIAGAQASIYARAQDVLEKSLPILDNLYTLDETADTSDIESLREVIRSQMTELVNELGTLGGPRVPRVNQYFNQLLNIGLPASTTVKSDPDAIGGSLGDFRGLLGLTTTLNFVNSMDDERNQTFYRLLSDNLTSLAQTYVNNLAFFQRTTTSGVQPFFGTQLVLLSRQLSVISESVEEVRFALDSVFIGPAERQTLLLKIEPQPMFIEELLTWVQAFCTDEGPTLIEKGGKLGVGYGFVDSVTSLTGLVTAASHLRRHHSALPPGFFTARVNRAWCDLLSQLTELGNLAGSVQRKLFKKTN
jgi:hypothetical protein